MKWFIGFLFGLLVFIVPMFCSAEDISDPAEKNRVQKYPIESFKEDPLGVHPAYEEAERLKDEEQSHYVTSNRPEDSLFKGFRVLFGIGYEGYFVSNRHTFDFNLFMEYDWQHFGLSLNFDCGLSGGDSDKYNKYDSDSDSWTYSSNTTPSVMVNLNAQFVYPLGRGFLFSAGVGPGMAYLNEVFFAVRISAGIDKAFDNVIIGASLNYVPMLNFNDKTDHAFGVIIHIGRSFNVE